MTRSRCNHGPSLSLAVVTLALVAGGCPDSAQRASEATQRELPTGPAAQAKPRAALNFAIGGIVTTKEGFKYYRKLLAYLEQKMGRQIKIIDRQTYAQINLLLQHKRVDAAFVCGGPYVQGRTAFGLELLVVPQVKGGTHYHSVVIVNAASELQRFEQLKGKTFAFMDPNSNTGKIAPTYLLARRGETPASFFGKQIYTYAHDKSILAVAQGVVDAAAVDSLILDNAIARDKGLAARVREIWRSPPYGIPPVAVRPGLDQQTKDLFKRTLLTAHTDGDAKPILKGMGVDRFVLGQDSAYDSIREMKLWIERQRRARASKQSGRPPAP